MLRTHRFAAIDIGTVTTRLLIADVTAKGVTEILRSTDITHLGVGVASTGRLDPLAMQRVTDVIERYSGLIADAGVERTIALATSASRDAENSDVFMSLLAEKGVFPEIIPGKREAYLSFLGAASGFPSENLLVVDIGGGSTEVVLGDAIRTSRDDDELPDVAIESARSFDIGARRVTDLFLRSDPPAPEEIDAARAWIVDEMRNFFESLREKPSKLLALAGTATTAVSIYSEMEEYDSSRVHGVVLSGADLSDIVEMLVSLPLGNRRDIIGLHPDRAPVIVGGMLILETVLALSGLPEFTASESDILYGIVIDAYCELAESGR